MHTRQRTKKQEEEEQEEERKRALTRHCLSSFFFPLGIYSSREIQAKLECRKDCCYRMPKNTEHHKMVNHTTTQNRKQENPVIVSVKCNGNQSRIKKRTSQRFRKKNILYTKINKEPKKKIFGNSRRIFTSPKQQGPMTMEQLV